MINQDKYYNILKVITNYYGFTNQETLKFLKDKNAKYLLLLFLKKYKCLNEEKTKEILKTKRVGYMLKKAEEKFFINREFRYLYFEIENKLEESNTCLNKEK